PSGAGYEPFSRMEARSVKSPSTRVTRSPKGASRSRASASAVGSRSIPRSRARVSERSRSACPPAPTVASTKNPPRSGSRAAATSSSRTGVCGLASIGFASFLPHSQEQLRELVVVLRTELLGRELLGQRTAVGQEVVIDVAGDAHV